MAAGLIDCAYDAPLLGPLLPAGRKRWGMAKERIRLRLLARMSQTSLQTQEPRLWFPEDCTWRQIIYLKEKKLVPQNQDPRSQTTPLSAKLPKP